MEISENINCTYCFKTYEILVHEDEDEIVRFCSYCGELIELQEEDDGNWDT